jgi:hypothetical protein
MLMVVFFSVLGFSKHYSIQGAVRKQTSEAARSAIVAVIEVCFAGAEVANNGLHASREMAPDDLIGDWHGFAVRAGRALYARLFTEPAHPLVGAGR